MKITVNNLVYSYTKGGKKALDGVSYDFEPSSIYIIKGENGNGKSTLVKALTGIIPVDGVYYDGQRMTKKNLSKVRSDIGCLLQNPARQLFAATVLDEMRFVYELQRSLTPEIDKKITELLEIFGLNGLINRFPQSLSGGEIQKLALATVFLKDAKVLILDEPTSALDFESKKLLVRLLTQAAANKCVIAVTHDEEFAALLPIAETVVMREGKLCCG